MNVMHVRSYDRNVSLGSQHLCHAALTSRPRMSHLSTGKQDDDFLNIVFHVHQWGKLITILKPKFIYHIFTITATLILDNVIRDGDKDYLAKQLCIEQYITLHVDIKTSLLLTEHY